MPAEQIVTCASPPWMGFVVEMTKALAWPALILIGCYTFRRHIDLMVKAMARSLARSRLTKAGPFEWERDLAPAMNVVAAVAESRVAKAKEEVSTAQPEVRQQKVEELASAIENAVVIKRAQHVAGLASFSTRLDNLSPTERALVDDLLLTAVSILGPGTILNADEVRDQETLSAQLSSLVHEGKLHPRANRLGVRSLLRRAGVLEDSKLTPNGWEQLRAAALKHD